MFVKNSEIKLNNLGNGIFEIFIPGVCAGECYKYELKF